MVVMKKPMLILLFGGLAVVTTFTVGWKLTHADTANPFSGRVLPAATTPASRNANRKADLEAIGTALNAYIAVHPKLPITITKNDTEICSSVGATCKRLKRLDLAFLLGNNGTLISIPTDPVGRYGQYSTGYTLAKDAATGKFRLTAPHTEGSAVIVVEK